MIISDLITHNLIKNDPIIIKKFKPYKRLPLLPRDSVCFPLPYYIRFIF